MKRAFAALIFSAVLLAAAGCGKYGGPRRTRPAESPSANPTAPATGESSDAAATAGDSNEDKAKDKDNEASTETRERP